MIFYKIDWGDDLDTTIRKKDKKIFGGIKNTM